MGGEGFRRAVNSLLGFSIFNFSRALPHCLLLCTERNASSQPMAVAMTIGTWQSEIENLFSPPSSIIAAQLCGHHPQTGRTLLCPAPFSPGSAAAILAKSYRRTRGQPALVAI